MADTGDVYAIRCFLNGKRKFTSKLSVKQALHFRQAALHLANYLTTEYSLTGAVGGHAVTQSDQPPE